MSAKRIYIAGPYTAGDPCVNTHTAIEAGNALLDAGFAPMVPHLSHFWHTMTPRDYEDWMRIDLAWVAAADAVLRLPGHSPGADREEACAIAHGVPVFHSLADLLAAGTGRPAGEVGGGQVLDQPGPIPPAGAGGGGQVGGHAGGQGDVDPLAGEAGAAGLGG